MYKNKLKKIREKLIKFHQKFEPFYLWAILLLAMLNRFTGLVKRDFWYDEAFTGVVVKENFQNMIAMTINDVHPPLFYIALKGFSFFFSYSVFGIRLFSAIFGVLSIWALYLLAKELFSRRVALYASLLATLSPFAIQYSQEARMYMMLVFFVLIATYFFIKGLKSKVRKYFIWWGVFMGLSMLTHYMGIIFASVYYAVFVVWKIFEIDLSAKDSLYGKIQKIVKKLVPSKELLVGYGTAFVVFLPWLKMFVHHVLIKGSNLSWVKPANFGDIIVNIQMFLFGTPLGEMSSGMPQPNELFGIAHISIRMTIAMLFGIGIVYLMQKERKEKVLSLLVFSTGFMFIIYVLSVSLPEQQYFVARYLLPAAYFIFIFIGLWLSKLRFFVVALIFGFYLGLISFTIPLTNSQGYNEMILHMDKYKSNNFYVMNAFDYVIAKYYFGADKLTLFNYDWPGYDPSYWAAIGDSLKRSENQEDIRSNPNALIISNKPLVTDNQYFSIQGLVLVDQYKNILIYKFK